MIKARKWMWFLSPHLGYHSEYSSLPTESKGCSREQFMWPSLGDSFGMSRTILNLLQMDSWVTKVDTFGEMKSTSVTCVVYECLARKLLNNTFIGLNRQYWEGRDRVDFSHVFEGNLAVEQIYFAQWAGEIPWHDSPVSWFTSSDRRPCLFSLMVLSDP